MSTPLEIRRVPARSGWRFVTMTWATAFIAGVLLVNTLFRAATTDLSRFGQLNSVMFGIIAVVVLTASLRRLVVNRGVLRTNVIIRLDDKGVSVRHGTVSDGEQWAHLAWADLGAVVVRLRTIGQPLLSKEATRPVLFFVARDEAAIKVDRVTAYDTLKGVALGLSPAAAILSVIVASEGPDQVHLVEEWLTQNRPDVLFQAPNDLVH